MERMPINSKTIEAVAYNEDTGSIHVWMRNRRHLIHGNISKAMFENMVSTDDPDFYYRVYIKG